MPAPTEAIFEVFKDSFKHIDWDNLSEEKNNHLTGNITAAMSDIYKQDLEDIKAKLAANHLRAGKYINNGSAAYIFELETDKGEKIESAILRIEQAAFSEKSDSVVVRKPIKAYTADSQEPYFQASVMPRATRPEIPNPTFAPEDMAKTFAVINTEGHLGLVSDIGMQQIMLMHNPDGSFVSYRDGTPVGIITDQNCMTGLGDAMGGVKSFCEDHKLNYDAVQSAKVPEEELRHLRTQMDAVYAHTEKEMNDAIERAKVPTQMTGASAVAIGRPPQRTVA